MDSAQRKKLISAYSNGKAYVPEPAVLLSMSETMSNQQIAEVTGIALNLVSRKLAMARELSNLPPSRKKKVVNDRALSYPARVGLEMTDEVLSKYRELIAANGGYRKFASILGVTHGSVYKPIWEGYMGRSMLDRIAEKTGVKLG